MKRRRLLSALGRSDTVGLAGCLTTGLFVEGEMQRGVSLTDQDSVADDLETPIGVEILKPIITDTHTARLQITTTNEGPKRNLSIGTDRCGLLNRSRGGSEEPPGLWLYQPERAQNIEREANRWVRASSAQPREFPMYGCRVKQYATGESVSNEYILWDDYQVDGYLTPGTYRWEEDVEIWEGPSSEYVLPPERVGFSLTIEDPD